MRQFAPQQIAALFDHIVGAGKQPWRQGEVEHPGGLGVDDQFELGCLHDRHVCRLGAFEDAPGMRADLTPCVGDDRPPSDTQ